MRKLEEGSDIYAVIRDLIYEVFIKNAPWAARQSRHLFLYFWYSWRFLSITYLCVWGGESGGWVHTRVCLKRFTSVQNCQLKFFDENCKINTQRPSKMQILWDDRIGIYKYDWVWVCVCENDSAVWIHTDWYSINILSCIGTWHLWDAVPGT